MSKQIINIIIHQSQLNDAQIAQIKATLGGVVARVDLPHPHYRLAVDGVDLAQMHALSDAMQIDINRIPDRFDGTACRLIISDMDSTFITIECIDEIADFAGLRLEVAKITEQAMRGEINFEQSFTARMSLLAGVPVSVLQRVFDERLRLSPGAKALVKTSQNLGVWFGLISGGFDFFADRLRANLGLDFAKANPLDVVDGRLTGAITSEIVGAGAKRAYLLSLCEKLKISPRQTIAMGDGANDLQMMSVAGLRVAYRAKPAVVDQADVQINFGGLDAVLDFLYPVD